MTSPPGGIPYFPQTLDSGTVVGRTSAGAGPTEEIPFSELAGYLLIATSATSMTIQDGSVTFTTQTGLAWPVGGYIVMLSQSNPVSDQMIGQLTAYNPGTGVATVNVTYTLGSGTYSAWNLYLGAPPGATGPTGSAGGVTVPQCGQLQGYSNIYINFVPMHGNQLAFPFDGTGNTLLLATIPENGILFNTPGTQVAGQFYYVYATQSGGVVNNLVLSQTVPTQDQNYRIRYNSGNVHQVLVGMVGCVVNGTFGLPLDDGPWGPYSGSSSPNDEYVALVRSWFNDLGVSCVSQLSSTATAVSPTYSELSTSLRCYILTWGGDELDCSFSGGVQIGVSNNQALTAIGMDGSLLSVSGLSTAYSQVSGSGTGQWCNPAFHQRVPDIGEGMHTVTVYAALGTGETGTNTYGSQCLLSVSAPPHHQGVLV